MFNITIQHFLMKRKYENLLVINGTSLGIRRNIEDKGSHCQDAKMLLDMSTLLFWGQISAYAQVDYLQEYGIISLPTTTNSIAAVPQFLSGSS